MKQIGFLTMLALAVPLFAADNKGTVPRSSAAAYPEHAQSGEIAIGAAVLTKEQVRKTFVSDVSRCCLVVEVAVYPPANGATNFNASDFVLRTSDENATRPLSTEVVVGMLHKDSGSGRTVNIAPGGGVGYQSGIYDPVTGPQAPGPVYQAGVAVSTPSTGPKPGSTEKERNTMESELSAHALPEGQATAPVSGYLYFPISGKKKCDHCQLEYTLNGTKGSLTF